MHEFIVGLLLILVGLWIHENWGRMPKERKEITLRTTNRLASFVVFVLTPALVLAFFSSAILAGIHAGIHNLPDDAPVTWRDGFMLLIFSLLYGWGFHWFLPRPTWSSLDK